MVIRKTFLFIVLFSSFVLVGKATGIAGGDLSVSQIDDSTFSLNFRLYKYCTAPTYPAKIDSSSSSSLARVYENGTDNLMKYFSSISFDSIVNIPLGDACYTPPGLCLDVVYYSSTVILPPNVNGYYVTWKVCCKNFEGNFQGTNSYLFYAQFPNPLILGKNSSPQFNSLDNKAYSCIGYEKDLDFSCTDFDGDSLVYSLITPYNDFSASGSKPFVTSSYSSGFSLNKIYGPGSICKIDSSTGIVSVRSAQLGIFSISVKCEEYRNGVKLGEVTKTFVSSSLSCNLGSPIYFVNIPSTYNFQLGKKNCFDVVARSFSNTYTYLNFSSNVFNLGAKVNLPDSNQNGSYNFEWNDSLFGIKETVNGVEVFQTSSTNFFSKKDEIGARFCWEPIDCEFYKNDSYFVDVQAILDRCGMTDTATIRLTINFDSPESIFQPNSFSPNGDGIEDVFRIKKDNECLAITQTKIYSITGQLVFESDDPNFFWNGKDFLDKDVSGGIYFVVYEGFYGETQTTESFKLLLYR